jgi:predicted transcriptional regulator
MKLAELVQSLGLEVLTSDRALGREVTNGYVSDLLSDVIANVEEGSVWITIQRHINILGVAKLKDVAAIVISRDLQVDQEVIEKANQEDIPMLRSKLSSFEISGLIYKELQRA